MSTLADRQIPIFFNEFSHRISGLARLLAGRARSLPTRQTALPADVVALIETSGGVFSDQLEREIARRLR
jgi:hypothetical protein